jgi:hypothetical protein
MAPQYILASSRGDFVTDTPDALKKLMEKGAYCGTLFYHDTLIILNLFCLHFPTPFTNERLIWLSTYINVVLMRVIM